jgi:hypothetical protein
MRCFVIMPYDPAFDDPFSSIRRAIERVHDPEMECIRLDQQGVSGRIVNQLEKEIRRADLCIAEVTPSNQNQPGGANPNVMWEIGFAMALEKPIFLVSHGVAHLPFDVQGVQHITYDRAQLSRTLEERLLGVLQRFTGNDTLIKPNITDDITTLRVDIQRMSQTVERLHELIAKNYSGIVENTQEHSESRLDPSMIVGAWKELESGSVAYVEIIDDLIVAPYCYQGNGSLTGVYYDWKIVNDWFFGRYVWIDAPIRGFSFLRLEGDELVGAWWYEGDALEDPNHRPDPRTGWTSRWKRLPPEPTPSWAKEFFKNVRDQGHHWKSKYGM